MAVMNRSRVILISESDPELRERVSLMLNDEGYTVIDAEGAPGDRLLACSPDVDDEELPVDLVLSDATAGPCGLTLLRAARAARRRVPFVLWSVPCDFSIRAEASSLGVAAFLEKPVPLGVVREVVHMLLPLEGDVRRAS